MPRPRPRARALAVSAAVFFASGEAGAFCRTTTESPAPSFQPAGDNCWTTGLPIWWKDSCVAYEIEQGGGQNLPYDAVAAIAADAFGAWTSVTCASGAVVMAASQGKPVPASCTAVGYVKGAKNNVNEIIFHDGAWPYNDGVNTLALTTVTFNSDTGQILDADIELNSSKGQITTQAPTSTTFDLASILTHESGHFFGLAHSGHTEATMYSMYTPGSTSMRTLAADDKAGLCAIYGQPARPTATGSVESSCSSPPRGTYDGSCPAPSGGCSAAGAPDGGAATSALAALALGALARRMRGATAEDPRTASRRPRRRRTRGGGCPRRRGGASILRWTSSRARARGDRTRR